MHGTSPKLPVQADTGLETRALRRYLDCTMPAELQAMEARLQSCYVKQATKDFKRFRRLGLQAVPRKRSAPSPAYNILLNEPVPTFRKGKID